MWVSNKKLLALFFTGLVTVGYGQPIRQTKYNLGFEYAKNDSLPACWVVRNISLTGYPVTIDTAVAHSGRSSVKARWHGVLPQVEAFRSWGGFQNFLPVEPLAGKEVEFGGWVKTDDSDNVCAGYAVFSYVPGKTERDYLKKIDTVGGVRGGSDWTRHSARLKIDPEAQFVMIAGFVDGEGTAWFDDVEIRIDGKKMEDSEIELKTELSDEERRALRQYVCPLRTVEPDGGSEEDLEAFVRLLGDCRVVGLGECTHGTSEAFKMKDRIIRYLAAHEGFDTFAIEADMPNSYRLNDYTVGGEGDSKQLIRGLYVWPWMTSEMLSLVEWMKKYNGGERKIAYTGVDMQFYASALSLLQEKVAANADLSRQAEELAEKMRSKIPGYIIDPETAAELLPDLDAFAANGQIDSLADEERTWTLQCVTLLRQLLSQTSDSDWRDRGMADNMLWILGQQPGSRAALWAHNSHVYNVGHPASMGYYLKQALGAAYRSVGFVAYGGQYLAIGNNKLVFDLPAPEPGTLEYLLGQLDEPLFVLDMKRMREERAMPWLDELEFRYAGATPELFSGKNVTRQFDYLIFLRDTSPSHLLRF